MNQNESILKAKIMIVDDNLENVLVLEHLLKRAGFSAYKSLQDPREAEALYNEFRPDLVLLDLNMPHIDGFGVMEAIKKIEVDSYIPVLILTAQQDQQIKLRALKAGAKDFLLKPFDRLEVINRINNMLEVRLLHNQIKDQNHLLEEKVRERTMELNETRLEIIQRLGRASEYRDNETGAHIIRMSKMCVVLGKALGFDAHRCELLLNASPMHDVGKIGVPDKILLKPGKLDKEEFDIMKTHTTIGAELLSGHDSELMELAHDIAITHHEKWDGSGYPTGLKGKNIPIEGRICAICDVYDALTSVRPYKKAWSNESALAEIYGQSGRHFDPDLVEKFKNLENEMRTLKDQHAEM